MAFKGLCLLAT